MDMFILIESTRASKVYLCSYCGERIVCEGNYDEYSFGYEALSHSCVGSDEERSLSNKCKKLKEQLYETDRLVGQQRKKRVYVYKYNKVYKLDETVQMEEEEEQQ